LKQSVHGLRPEQSFHRPAAKAKRSPACGQSKAFTGLRPKQSFHRPAARAKLSPACGQSKAFTGLRPARPFSRRKRAQNALRRARAGAAPAAPIRCASWQPQAGAELARPCALNTGAYSLRLPAMLAALYGALLHSARASMRYTPAFPFHPTAIMLRRIHACGA
jgi:hypothetical protein